MSASEAIVRVFAIGGFRAEVSVPIVAIGTAGQAVVEWTPRVPRFNVDFDHAQRATYARLLAEAVNEASRA